MAIQIQGNGGTVAEVDGTTHRALRTTLRGPDYGSLGVYSISTATGTIGAALAANGELFQFRWTDATRLCAIHSVQIAGGANVAATAAAVVHLQAMIARSFTAAGTGGGTATITGNNNKLRTSMGTTLLGELRTATTAALGAGTKTLDSQAVGGVAIAIGTGALTVSPSMQLIPPTFIFNAADNGYHPIILAQNEGLVVKNGAVAWPATMTWGMSATITWSELTAY